MRRRRVKGRLRLSRSEGARGSLSFSLPSLSSSALRVTEEKRPALGGNKNESYRFRVQCHSLRAQLDTFVFFFCFFSLIFAFSLVLGGIVVCPELIHEQNAACTLVGSRSSLAFFFCSVYSSLFRIFFKVAAVYFCLLFLLKSETYQKMRKTRRKK